jgi:hypothetical protein
LQLPSPNLARGAKSYGHICSYGVANNIVLAIEALKQRFPIARHKNQSSMLDSNINLIAYVILIGIRSPLAQPHPRPPSSIPHLHTRTNGRLPNRTPQDPSRHPLPMHLPPHRVVTRDAESGESVLGGVRVGFRVEAAGGEFFCSLRERSGVDCVWWCRCGEFSRVFSLAVSCAYVHRIRVILLMEWMDRLWD